MNPLIQVLRRNPELAVFLTLAIGFLVVERVSFAGSVIESINK